MDNIIFTTRKQLGISQKEFAKRLTEELPSLKTCKVDISRWENGYHLPDYPVIKIIAKFSKKTPDEVAQNLTENLRSNIKKVNGKTLRTSGKNPRQEVELMRKMPTKNQLSMF